MANANQIRQTTSEDIHLFPRGMLFTH